MRLMALLAPCIVVRRIALQRPDLKIYQRGSAFNFDDIAAKFRSDTTGRKPQFSMLDYEKIQALDFKSEAVNAFADSLVRLLRG